MVAQLRGRSGAVAVAVLVSVALVVPHAFSASRLPDEDQYVWSAAYYGKKVRAADFAEHGTDAFRDPGWDPGSYWGRSMGTRAVYAVGLAAPWVEAPAAPYSYVDRRLQGPETRVDRRSLVSLRLLAVLCATVGGALVALRFGWPGALSIGLLVLAPQNDDSLARAWAEGPVLLAFGLIAVAFGSRWFPFVLGAASTAKLTVVGLWPLVLLRRAHGWRSRLLALAATAATWTLLTPPSWYRGGPFMILTLADVHVAEYSTDQSGNGGLYLPARYFWPFELAILLAVTLVIASRRGREATEGRGEFAQP